MEQPSRISRSLGRQLSLRVGALSVVAMLAMVTLIVLSLQLTLRQVELDAVINRNTANSAFTNFFVDLRSALLTASTSLAEIGNPSTVLASLQLQNRAIQYAAIADVNGEILTVRRAPGYQEPESATIAAFAQNPTQFEEVRIDTEVTYLQGSPEISMYVTTYDNIGFPTGLLFIRASLRELVQTTLDLRLGETGYAYIVDADDQILASRFAERTGEESNLQFYTQRTINSLIGTTLSLYTGLGGELVLGSASPIPDTNWYTVTEQPVIEALGPFLIAVVLLLIVIIFIVALVVSSAVFTRKRVLHPLAQLTDAVSEMNTNQRARPVKLDEPDELGLLATSFNRMTSDIRELLDTLEDRVAERTRELEEARRIAEAANSAKSTFLSNMSHELRTPLNMVIGYTSSMLNMPQMYGNRELPEVYRGDIELIQSSGQHLLGLINDVLDLSKIEAGKLELQFASTDLNEIFNGVIATATGLTKDKPVQLRQDFSSDLPRVWADSLRVRQILLNLLSNAIKFTDTGSVTLRARVEGDYIDIAVIDTGIGIPEDALQTIFERYEQVRGQKGSLGTGLGLDISQRLAEMLGGRLLVESVYGQGSTFAFQLPLTTPEQDMDRPPTLPSRSAMGMKIFRSKPVSAPTLTRSILLIEDESETRKQIHDALEAAGHLVVDTHEGGLALELAETLQPDLILLDAHLSGTNADEMLRALAQNPLMQGIPVILLGEPADATAGAHPFLPKPIQFDALEQSVQTVLGQPV